MQAGQALLRGVGRLQAVLLAALGAVPGLAGVVHPSDVVGAWAGGTAGVVISHSSRKLDSHPPIPSQIPAPVSACSSLGWG